MKNNMKYLIGFIVYTVTFMFIHFLLNFIPMSQFLMGSLCAVLAFSVSNAVTDNL